MARPSLVRYSIVGLAMGINMLCYTDRVCVAVAGPRIRSDLGLSQAQLGLVFSIFFLAYAAAQAPWGMLADRFGSRGIVTAAIFCWSVFTALTGAVWGLPSMLAVRFTFGTLEAALSPATATAFTRWAPVAERSTSFGAYLSGGRLGAALTPPLAAFLMLRFGWRTMFAIFGSMGGMITGYLTRRLDARRGRLYLGCSGLLLTGMLMSLGVLSPLPRAGALLMAVAAGTIDLYLGAAWSSAVDIGGRSGGAVAGLMNASSNCAGFASPALMGWVLQTTNNWNTVLFAGIVSTFIAAYLWTQVNPAGSAASI